MNPNGVQKGKGTYLSIFLIIVRSENDATIEWPFQKRVSFSLIDQQETDASKQNIVRTFGEPTPTATQGNRFANDFFDFVSHKALQERRYIVDDTILIQVVVT